MRGLFNQKQQDERIEELLEKTVKIKTNLFQETKDKEQLNPQKRLVSINNVLNAVKGKLGRPKTAINIGSGFAYETVLLHIKGIKAVGIEKVHLKNIQALTLFHRLEILLVQTEELDFSKSPAILEADFHKMRFDKQKVDLITMFYLSKELIMNPETLRRCEKLLKKNGKILLSTEVNSKVARQILNSKNFPLPKGFSVEIIKIPRNFEKTVVILKGRSR